MAREYPALELRASNIDLLYAALDDFSPTAIEDFHEGIRAFFLTAAERDAAHRQLSAQFSVAPIDVPDEDWARRSQEGLTPVTVGRLTFVPNQEARIVHIGDDSAIENPQSAIVVIQPSMGFGTGHHATTRLCLAALQAIDLHSKTVLDVGTGSGILAIAARLLGASHATGVDIDPDAIQSARENLELNAGLPGVEFEIAGLESMGPRRTDVVTANLTGALLVREAPRLLGAAGAAGTLIVSGLMAAERAEVVRAFAAATVFWERTEDEWVCLAMKKP